MDPMRQDPWWALKDASDAGRGMVALIRQQLTMQAGRYQLMRRYIGIYEYSWRASDRLTTSHKEVDETILAFNRAQNAVDSLLGQVCAAKVSPVCYTDGGTYEEQEQAKEATRALDALFEEVEFDRVFEDMARDAACCGTGFIKVFPDFDACAVRVQRIPSPDVIVDDAETRYGSPRCMYQRCIMDRYQVAECYGEPYKALEGSARDRRMAILRASGAPSEDGSDATEANLEVFEGWHLPSRFVPEAANSNAGMSDGDEESEPANDNGEEPDESSDDGRRLLAIEPQALIDAEYCRESFPFVEFTPKRPRIGFWGIPVMRLFSPAQRECEILDESFQVAHRRLGGAHLLVPRNADVTLSKLTNGKGTKIEYSGQIPPREWTPTPVNEQQYRYMDQLESRMLRFSGQNELGAQGQLPSGLESGRAIKSFVSEGSRYMGDWLRERERVVRRVIGLMLDAVAELVARKPNLSVRFKDGDGYRTIEWKRILDIRHRLVFRTTPINALSTSWAGRQDTIDSWYNSGAIDADMWRKLGDVPDLRSQNAYDLSWEQLAQQKLDRMVRTGKYESPSQFGPLDKQKVCAGKFHDMAEGQGVSDMKLRLIRRFIADCDRMMNPPSTGPAAPPPTPGGGTPVPAPEAPPTGGGAPMPVEGMPMMPGPAPMPPMGDPGHEMPMPVVPPGVAA